MIINETFALGVMSGTSLDGVDVVYVQFDEADYQNFKILHAQTFPYSKEWKALLQNAIHQSAEELKVLDVVYGQFLAGIINDFMDTYAIKKINFIASHGHTVLHQPKKGIT